eukprot:TRINITY_DN29275_c0_g1_i1.p1 TRINITY_DN29275_c0_g1~~TRINITY_DN29275_c0_g1_i1.p1  ORF type:complete len:476 (+),score=211.61 TRINITY_DN29275_c0_g1_i1:59-1429(+)
MAAAAIPDAECSFVDTEGDTIRLTAELQGKRGRVALFHNGKFFKFVKELVYVRPESKLYVNGHEATIVLKAEGLEDCLASIEHTCKTGRVNFAAEDSYDAAAALAKVRAKEAEDMEEELDGLSPEMAAKARAAAAKKANKKKSVPKDNLEKLIGMGVPEVRAVRAFALCDGTTVEAALAYIEKASNDPNLDKPIDEALAPVFAVPLTKEEKEAKAKELQAMIEAKKKEAQQVERKRQVDLELKRRETEKQLQDIKEETEKKKRMEAYAERKREKEEDLRAKAAIREKIAADRAAKGWKELPEDGADAGKEAPKMKASEIFKKEETRAADDDWDPFRLSGGQPAAAPVPQPLPSAEGLPRPGIDLSDDYLQQAVDKVKSAPDTVKTLKAYIGNVVGEPFNAKFRSIKTTNAVFSRTILATDGAATVLLLLGFRSAGERLAVSSVHIPTFAKALEMLG